MVELRTIAGNDRRQKSACVETLRSADTRVQTRPGSAADRSIGREPGRVTMSVHLRPNPLETVLSFLCLRAVPGLLALTFATACAAATTAPMSR